MDCKLDAGYLSQKDHSYRNLHHSISRAGIICYSPLPMDHILTMLQAKLATSTERRIQMLLYIA